MVLALDSRPVFVQQPQLKKDRQDCLRAVKLVVAGILHPPRLFQVPKFGIKPKGRSF
jgi:hypothetical protein